MGITEAQQNQAATDFSNYWRHKGDEKSDSQRFWIDFIQDVLGIENVTQKIEFEKKVNVDGQTKFIDVYIPETRTLIEQKSVDKDLTKQYQQSGGWMATPFQQARRYSQFLPVDEAARWIIACNFKIFEIHDMNKPQDEPLIVELDEIRHKLHFFDFMFIKEVKELSHEMEISVKAGEIVGILYDKLLEQYKNPNEESLKSLNALCVRLVFCFYAEDAGIFGKNRSIFQDYLSGISVANMRKALIELFKVLDTRPEDRDKYLAEDNPILAAFPYVNGGLFADENIEIPSFSEEIRELVIRKAGADFDWSDISPTIFGAVFESTLNPETRRSGGMHYTSIENIHKVIDPLFLDDFKAELAEIEKIDVSRTKDSKLREFQDKLATLTFFDPACGSGNFLTETYISIRRLENQVLRDLSDMKKNQVAGQLTLLDALDNPIKVSINHFYGIEINDFAVTVAKTALWIAESQMMKETENILVMKLDFLPLKTNAYIHEGNALKTDWNEIIPIREINFIMGNPPFVGGMYMTATQKEEIHSLFADLTGAGELDYVTGWYKKTVDYIMGTNIKVAFVSTNSICQGSQVITFWKYLMNHYEIKIDFAYRTFVWNNETNNQAKVHCIIVGFSNTTAKEKKRVIYIDESNKVVCDQISPYLTNTPVIFVDSRKNPICNVPEMHFGSMPRDGGGFVLSPKERAELIKKEPISEKWIRPYVGAEEFLNGKERYCLWLVNADPSEIAKCPIVKKRVEYVKQTRENSKAAGTRKFASTPTLFCQIAQSDTDYIIIPKTSSGKRRYIPIGFMDANTIASDLVFLIPKAGLYEFGILMSNVHNAWMRLVAGRMKSDYRYAKDIVYNNFVWCTPTEEDRRKIEETAQKILDARKLYPNSSLANLYDEALMPKELRQAHVENDRAVMKAYGFPIKNFTEDDCVAELMKEYQKLVSGDSV